MVVIHSKRDFRERRFVDDGAVRYEIVRTQIAFNWYTA